jgi:hypothetical protein
MLLGLVDAKLDNMAINQSVVFVKQSDIIMKSDHWHAVINFNLTPCMETVSMAGLWVGRAGPLPRALTSMGRQKRGHRPATR